MPRGTERPKLRFVAHKKVDDNSEATLFRDNKTLVHLFPCDDYRSGHLPEWLQVCVCYDDSGCHKERLVVKLGYR